MPKLKSGIPQFPKLRVLRKSLKDNNSLHFVRKYALIFIFIYYLFLKALFFSSYALEKLFASRNFRAKWRLLFIYYNILTIEKGA